MVTLNARTGLATYELDNDSEATNRLAANQIHNDEFTVHVRDGSANALWSDGGLMYAPPAR